MSNNKVALELSQDEALVFLEWLSRFNRLEGAEFEDQAEQRVLWDIEAMLESVLVGPLDPNYDELLACARKAVRDGEVRGTPSFRGRN